MSRLPALLLLWCLCTPGCAMLKASPDDPWAASVRLPLQEQLLATGAWYNGGTSADDTSYWFRVPPEDFGTLAELEGWRLREPLSHLTEEDFASARNVVLAELRRRQETLPEGAQLSQLHAALLPGHPYGHAIGGTAESLQRLTLADARAFVERHYKAANAVVVASGPLPSPEVRCRSGSNRCPSMS